MARARLIYTHGAADVGHLRPRQRQHLKTGGTLVRESDNRDALLRMAGRLARIGAWSFSIPDHRVEWSDELRSMLGFADDGAPSFGDGLDRYPEVDRDLVIAALRECESTGAAFDMQRRMFDSSGKLLYVRVLGEEIVDSEGTRIGVQGAIYDITSTVESARARTDLEARLAATMASISDGIVIVDGDWAFTYLNPRAERLLGVQSKDVLGASMWDVFPEGRGTEFAIAYRRAVSESMTTTVRDYFEPLDLWLDVSAYPLEEGLAIYFRDVTSEEVLRRTIAEDEKKIAAQAGLLDVARDAIILRSLDHIIGYWNRSATSTYGWSAAEALGRSVRDLLYAGSKDFERATAATLRDGSWSGEIEQQTKSGVKIIADSTWTLVRDESGEPTSIFSVNMDITDKKRHEDGVLRAQRLESLGTLAGGVAHDLNNVLTPILLSTQTLISLEGEPSKRELLSTMESSIKRGADMIRQVLTFARGVEGRRIDVDMVELIDELRTMTKDSLPGTISIRTEVAPDLWHVLGDPTQLLQVLVNLVTNARDAMPKGGTLSIQARNVELGDNYHSVSHLATPGPYVLFDLEDTGCGMSAGVLNKIYEPFFTTKGIGDGTGLGLSTSLAILRSHGATIQAYSEVGRGTRFKIHLPALPTDPAGEAGESRSPLVAELPRGAGQRILVIDDEAAIRHIMRQTLDAFGYVTSVASNGMEALDVFADPALHIQLVVTDMMMPVMDGATTAAELLKLNPLLPIIAASGLNANGGVAQARASGVTRFLSKPFTTEELLTAVHDALSGVDNV